MSLISELQQAIDQGEKVSNLLIKAYMIAKKLNQKDNIEWLYNEMNGYQDNNTPDYRIIPVEYKKWGSKYIGWMDLNISKEHQLKLEQQLDGFLFKIRMQQSIKQIEVLSTQEEILNTNKLTKRFSANIQSRHQIHYMIKPTDLIELLNCVKSQILCWALDLENQGILGEDMTFTKEEKEKAQATPQIIHNTTIHNNAPNSNIQAGGTGNTITSNNTFTAENKKDFQDQFNKLEELIKQNQELSINPNILEDLQDIKTQLAKPTPRPHKITTALNGILLTAKGIPIIINAIKPLFSFFPQ